MIPAIPPALAPRPAPGPPATGARGMNVGLGLKSIDEVNRMNFKSTYATARRTGAPYPYGTGRMDMIDLICTEKVQRTENQTKK